MPILEASEAEQIHLRLQEIVSSDPDLNAGLLQLRQLLEEIYKLLSAQSNTSFNGLFARMQYVHSILALPAPLVTQVNQLRLLCNNVAHEKDFVPPPGAFPTSVWVLAQLLSWLAPEISNAEIENYLKDSNAEPFPEFKYISKKSFHCAVLDWKLLHKEGSEVGIEIRASSEEGLGIQILLNNIDSGGKHWSSLAKVLWKFCTLHCLNLSEVRGRENCFQSTPTTLIVVEPDFLLDASAVASCFSNKGYQPEYFIINLLLNDSTTEKLVQGNMVNNILDQLISSPQSSYIDLFRQSMAKWPISMVSLGKASALNIYRNIFDTHLPRIKELIHSLQGYDLQLEPSFISPEYGLQGRLDVLYFRDGIPHIVELKSGNAPRFDAWKQHQMQVIAYNMIIRNCFTKASRGTGSIFYSAATEHPLRHVVNTVQLEQDLLMCRNRIVGIMHGLAENPGVFFDWLITAKINAETSFTHNSIQNIVNTLRSLRDHEYAWFLEHLRLLVREVWFVKTGGLHKEGIYGHNALWQQSVKAKQERYRLISSLQIESLTFNKVRFKFPDAVPITDFRSGDIVLLYRENVAVSSQQILRGQIIEMDEFSVEILIRGGLRLDQKNLLDEKWALEHDVLESSLYAPLSSLLSFLQSGQSRRDLFLGLKEPQTSVAEQETGNYLQDLVCRIKASKHYHIVQGPPGTGKTSGLLTSYIKSVYNESHKNLLILSFTNRAVDEICLCLKREDVPFMRTGSSDVVTSELMSNLIDKKKFDEIAEILKANRIWVSTVSSCNAWLNDLLKVSSFDELIIDEASQIVENSILGIISKVDKTILIGDQNQLPPITAQVDQGFNFSDHILTGLCYGGYNQSLMERLNNVCKYKGWTSSITVLSRHYRMHDAIANLVQRYYADSLISILPRQRESLPVTKEALLSSRLIWIECPASLHPYYDPLQVKIIQRALDILTKEGIICDYEKDIGIVAPFRAMIHALLQEFTPEQRQITLDTVERFQGSERKNVIITLPLHNSDALRNIESLSGDGTVDRKLNVSLSRAEERIIIVGNRAICRKSAHYTFLMDKITEAGNLLQHYQLL